MNNLKAVKMPTELIVNQLQRSTLEDALDEWFDEQYRRARRRQIRRAARARRRRRGWS